MKTMAEQVADGVGPYVAHYAERLAKSGVVDAWVAGPANTCAGPARDLVAAHMGIDPSQIKIELINNTPGLFSARFRLIKSA